MDFLKVVLLVIILSYGNTSLAELNAERMNDIHYEFIKLKDGYAFSGKFFIQASDTCLIQIIYEPEHLKNLLKNRYAINIVRNDKDSYEVSYTYKKPFVEIKSTYCKTLKLSEKKVIFEMIANEQKGGFLPKVLSSHGSYEIKQENNGCWVEYYQECKVEHSNIERIYFFFAKNEAIKFLKDLKKYAERICH